MRTQETNLTYYVDLSGGKSRLKEIVLYISKKCENSEYFGKVKLNKILWRSDFQSFLHRGTPITGSPYIKLKNGPVPSEISPILAEMVQDKELKIVSTPRGQYIESRPFALAEPTLRYFSQDDLDCVDEAINFFWNDTASKASDKSHGIAWESREIGDAMPYELSYISDEKISKVMSQKLALVTCLHDKKSF